MRMPSFSPPRGEKVAYGRMKSHRAIEMRGLFSHYAITPHASFLHIAYRERDAAARSEAKPSTPRASMP
jgi:hypothetical protein